MRRIDAPKIILLCLTWTMAGVIFLALASLVLTSSTRHIADELMSPEILYALTFTLVSSLISAVLVMVFAVPIACTLSRVPFYGSRLVRTVLYLPMALPQIVLGLCLLVFLGSQPVASTLRAMRIDLVFTREGVVVAQFFTAFPFALRVLKSTFDGIDPRMEFISRSLGCSRLATFRRVSLPLAKRGLLASASVAFARCAGAFGSVLVLAGGMRMHTETLPIAIHLNLLYGNMSMAVTAGLLLIVVSSVGLYTVEMIEAKP